MNAMGTGVKAGATSARKTAKLIKGTLVASLLSLSIVIIAAITVTVAGIAAAMKGEAKHRQATSTATSDLAAQGLTNMTYFLLYESGTNLYNTVLGDHGAAFGAYQFDYRYALQPFIDYCLASDPEKYSLFAPFSSSRCNKSSLKGNSDLAAAWHMIYAADQEDFIRIQDEYEIISYYKPMEEYQARKGLHLANRPDAIKGLCLSIHNRLGLERSAYSLIQRAGITDRDSDETFARKLCAEIGKQGGSVHDRYLVDYSSAAGGRLCELSMVLDILGGRMTFSACTSDVPYYNQGNYGHVEYGSKTRTVATSGCGLCCMCMIATSYCGRSITPEDMAPWAIRNGADPAKNYAAFKTLAEHYGFRMVLQQSGPRNRGSSAAAVEALEEGKLVIANVQGGTFDSDYTGHYILCVGIRDDGRIIVHDPGSQALTNESLANGSSQQQVFGNCKTFFVFDK